MKIIKIDIMRDDIDKQLSKITAYTGVKCSSQVSIDDFDRIATVDEDADLLNRYWSNAANVLADRLKEFIRSFSISDKQISISMELSKSFDESLLGAVMEGMSSFVTAFIAKAWFCMTFPEKATEWDTECRRLLLEISRNIHHRRPPLRHKS